MDDELLKRIGTLGGKSRARQAPKTWMPVKHSLNSISTYLTNFPAVIAMTMFLCSHWNIPENLRKPFPIQWAAQDSDGACA